jgi:hypothetical protein
LIKTIEAKTETAQTPLSSISATSPVTTIQPVETSLDRNPVAPKTVSIDEPTKDTLEETIPADDTSPDQQTMQDIKSMTDQVASSENLPLDTSGQSAQASETGILYSSS